MNTSTKEAARLLEQPKAAKQNRYGHYNMAGWEKQAYSYKLPSQQIAYVANRSGGAYYIYLENPWNRKWALEISPGYTNPQAAQETLDTMAALLLWVPVPASPEWEEQLV